MKRVQALWAIFLFWAVGFAQAGGFLEIRPSVVEISATPGKTVKGYLSLRNPRAESLRVGIEVQDGWVTQIGKPSPVPPSEWLTLKIPKKLILRPNASKRIRYKIRVPPHLEGEALALVFFSGPPERGPGGNMGIQLRHGIPIYLSAKGTERVELTPSAEKAFMPTPGGLELAVTLVSHGNTHVRPKGEWVITDFFGGETERIPLEYGTPVFPGARQEFFARSKRPDWAPGEYKAHLTATYGDSFGPLQTMSKSFSLNVTAEKVKLTETPAPLN
ncbi:MAG: hypothetical protein JNK54_10135 [Elusimicrobia bacterium]|jgi:hypothetical protein|nr:hypothetical protein [Elusimicrobiota bacterium]